MKPLRRWYRKAALSAQALTPAGVRDAAVEVVAMGLVCVWLLWSIGAPLLS